MNGTVQDSLGVVTYDGIKSKVGVENMQVTPSSNKMGDYLKSDDVIDYEKQSIALKNMEASNNTTVSISDTDNGGDGRDSYFMEAAKIIIDKEKASIGMLQRYLKIGFNRAARIMDQLEEAGIVGPEEGTKPRKVLMTPEEFENFIEEGY